MFNKIIDFVKLMSKLYV